MEEFKVAKLPKTQNENFNISSVAKFHLKIRLN